jgi:4,5-dihydroxyphthalate decarboxylase
MKLSIACVATDRSRPILNRNVISEKYDFDFHFGEPEELFRIALQEARYDITELSMGSHITKTARGDSEYIGIPIFPSRAFRHSGIFIRSDRNINSLQDFKGLRVGVPEFQQTAGIWLRGMMADEYGVRSDEVSWRVGALNAPGPGERMKITLPEHMDVQTIKQGEYLDKLIREGEIDAIFSPREPNSLLVQDVPVKRLFDDVSGAEREYCMKTGFFPIMHCLAIKKTLLKDCPDLPEHLFKLFAKAKKYSLDEMLLGNVLRISLPWVNALQTDFTNLMGGNPWPYGLSKNHAEISALIRYAVMDGIAVKSIEPSELFHPQTHNLKDY